MTQLALCSFFAAIVALLAGEPASFARLMAVAVCAGIEVEAAG